MKRFIDVQGTRKENKMSLVQNRIERYVPVPYDKLNNARNRKGRYCKLVGVDERGGWVFEDYEPVLYSVHELTTHTSQKSYNKRAYVVYTSKGWYLFSYGTLVAVAFGLDNIFIKKQYLGNEYRTTTKHIKSFVTWCEGEYLHSWEKVVLPPTKKLMNYRQLDGHVIGSHPDDDYNAFCCDAEELEYEYSRKVSHA